MSGLAVLLKSRGFNVSGSDLKNNKLLDRLKSKGVKVYLGHKKSRINSKIDLVCVSSAIPADNSELQQAEIKNIPVVKRGELLADILKEKEVVAVSGSHGKTTTSSLIFHILKSLNLKCAGFVGGMPLNYRANAWWSEGRVSVVEADESDGTFLKYSPEFSVITNIDYEHLDFYRTKSNLDQAFRKFCINTSKKVFAWSGNKTVFRHNKECRGKIVFYGLGRNEELSAGNIVFTPLEKVHSAGENSLMGFTSYRTEFDIFLNGRKLGRVETLLKGRHNVLNILGAVGVCLNFGQWPGIKKAIKSFKGVERRLEVKYNKNGFLLIDDYAHHPAEIKAAISAVKTWGKKRIVAVFQPHRYSRLKILFKEFSECFLSPEVDILVITDIYPAQEKPLKGVSAKKLYQEIRAKRGNVFYFPKAGIKNKLPQILRRGDTVVSLGAGDIGRVLSADFEQIIKQKI